MGSQAKSSARARPERERERRAASAETREVLNSLRHIVRALRVSARSAEQLVGLSGAQLFVLQCLARHSPCSVNELAAYTATDQSSVSVVVSRLVARGHVKRVVAKADRRRVELSLTASGRALVLHAPEPAQDRLLAALGQLEKAEALTLSRLLAKVVELSQVGEGSPSLFFEEGTLTVREGRSRSHERK